MSLDQIALRTDTDKSSRAHNYTPLYEKYLGHLRNEPITLLEIGHGGYIYYDRGGQSAKMWKEYFSKATIATVDLYEKQPIEGIKFFQGSQTDEGFLNSVISQIGKPDIIIDDGSHHNDHTSKTFEILWPHLKSGGQYIVEDCHTSYWEANYGGTTDPHGHNTMNYFKRKADHLNYEVNGLPDEGMEYVHFYKEIIFIRKQ